MKLKPFGIALLGVTLLVAVPYSARSTVLQKPQAADFSIGATGHPLQFDIFSHTNSTSQDPLQLVSVTQGSRGDVKINPDGTITYTPNPTTPFRVYQADLAPGNAQANGNAYIFSPYLSNSIVEPRVVFSSGAQNLNSKNTVAALDGYLYDMLTGSLDWVTPTMSGSQPNDDSYVAYPSNDGRFVSFQTKATNMLQAGLDTHEYANIYVTDRSNGTVSLVSRGLNGEPGNGNSDNAWLSADGRYVLFDSVADNLVNAHTFKHRQAYLRDLVREKTFLISTDAHGNAGTDGDSSLASGRPEVGLRRMSDDGSLAVFDSSATNFAPGLNNSYRNIFLHDCRAGQETTLVTRGLDGNPGNGDSVGPGISGNGRTVIYFSIATNLVPDATGQNYEVYQTDLRSGKTKRLLNAFDGSEQNAGGANWYWNTPDGRYVSYSTPSTNVLPGISDGNSHCYLLDQKLNRTVSLDVNQKGNLLVNTAPAGTYGPYPPVGCMAADVSADGMYAVITEQTSSAVAGNSGLFQNVFVVTKTDRFTYTVSDGSGRTATGSVTIVEPLDAQGGE